MNKNRFEERLKDERNAYHNVVPLGPSFKLLKMDFTANNKELTDEILCDTELFSKYVSGKLEKGGAEYGIGGYDEHRTIYSRSRVFDASTSEEPRRLHLGVDIWGKADTPIYAPLTGTVQSYAFNDAYGDYGATLILQHKIDDLIFHTLYGHLSLRSIQEKKEGQTIDAGEWIASFGEAEENGHWPPHLHFQIILDIQGMKGDYPGVCKYSEREKYLDNCPDPDLILRMMQYAK